VYQCSRFAVASISRCGTDSTLLDRWGDKDGNYHNADGCGDGHRSDVAEVRNPSQFVDNADGLGAKLAIEGANLLVETIYTLDRIIPTPQEHAAATAAPPIQKPEYTIDWNRSHLEIHNLVRGFYPNCVATFRGQPLKILATVPLASDFQADLPPEIQKLLPEIETLDLRNIVPGTVIKIAKGLGPIVQTGSGCLLLQEVQPPGKRPQSGTDLVNGTRLAVGEVLG
jgi:methionyl-tRNA formyltransferase